MNLWLTEKFIEPLCHYYTMEATIIYGILLAIAALGVYNLLKYLKIKIDRRLFLGILPFILYGGWTRALRDYGLGIYSTSKLWCSPPIYFVVFGITIISLLLGILIQKKFKIEYYKTMITIGATLLLYNILLTQIVNWEGFAIIIGLISIWAIIFFGLHKKFPKKLSFRNTGIITAHLFDASATFTAVSFFGFSEQHVVPSYLFGIFGPWIFFPVKIIVVYLVLYLIDKYSDDKFFNNFLKIIIVILGLSQGLRDFLTVSML